ncbi:MAG: hypothetical protein CVU24_09175 [Betaproteobacteria bacterium HGW-Betaproteobacteria-18]|nr:MAG: hypothetical protein CVU24_09175 [Betaproteobacteria bacterium HGW-Betaproteobacteria-18]
MHGYISHPLRQQLVEIALQWERSYSVLPRVGDALSEFDAAMLVGHTPETFSKAMVGTTAVQKGFDFCWESTRYQVKHNRPSGKKGSKVTNAGNVTTNFEWDILIYVLYNEFFDIQEVWQWDVETYQKMFDSKSQKHISLKDMQKGKPLS